MEDFYQTLGVGEDASFAELRVAYRRAALTTHPDKGGSSESFRQVVLAFQVLSDESSRLHYDRKRKKKAAEERQASRVVETCTPPSPTSSMPNEAQRFPKKRRRCSKHESPCSREASTQDPERPTSGTYFGPSPCPQEAQLFTFLQRLQTVLQSMSPDQRRVSIDSLTPPERGRLADFMHRQAANRMGKEQVMVSDTGRSCSDEDYSSCTSSEESVDEEEPMLQLEDASCGEEDEMQHPTDEQPIHRQPGVESSFQGGVAVYRARISFANVKLFTKFQPRLETAVEHHIILTQASRTALVKARSYSLADGKQVEDACERVFAENNTSPGELGLRARFQLELHKQPHIYVSSPILSLHETLVWRSRALAVRYRSWPSFRAVWKDLLQHSGYARRHFTGDEADALIERGWAVISGQWKRMEERIRRAAARKDVGESERLQRRFQRAVKALQKGMELEAKGAKRQASDAARKERKREQIRARWWRENWSHLTMDEILQGPPSDLT